MICSPAALINMQKKKMAELENSTIVDSRICKWASTFPRFFFLKKVTNRLFTVNGHSNQIESKSWNQSKNKPVTPVVADLIELGPQWNTPGFQLSPKHRLHSVVNQIFSYEIFFSKRIPCWTVGCMATLYSHAANISCHFSYRNYNPPPCVCVFASPI